MSEDKSQENKNASKLEDYNLIEKAIKGDQSSYDRLMKKYYKLVHNLIYRMIYNKEDVDR